MGDQSDNSGGWLALCVSSLVLLCAILVGLVCLYILANDVDAVASSRLFSCGSYVDPLSVKASFRQGYDAGSAINPVLFMTQMAVAKLFFCLVFIQYRRWLGFMCCRKKCFCGICCGFRVLVAALFRGE